MPTSQTMLRPPSRPQQDQRQTEPQTDWVQRVEAVLDRMPSLTSLPGFDVGTPLPTPEVFDEPIRSLEQTARTFDVVAENLERELDGVTWVCDDATRFRNEFSGTRRPQLSNRARDLQDLADDLRRIKSRTRDEREWIQLIEREVRDFLSRVQAAFQAAQNAAEEALADAQQVQRSASRAFDNAAGSASDLVSAGVDEVTGGDGSDELARAERRYQAAVGDAQDALSAVVDFTTNWTFNGTNLPPGASRAWYDVDTFMAQKASTTEAYGVTYTPRGAFQ
jgi:hypothetical protein